MGDQLQWDHDRAHHADHKHVYADHLAIPMRQDPARQRFWRAVGFVALVLLAIALGYLINRYFFIKTQAKTWPDGAVAQIRVLKTTRTIKHLDSSFASYQILPGTPWTVADAMSWTKKQLIIYTDGQNIVGIATDRALPTEVVDSLQNWGLQSTANGRHGQLISVLNSEIQSITEHSGSFWLFTPIFDGSIALKVGDEISKLPWRWSSDSSISVATNLTELAPKSELKLAPNTDLWAVIGLSAESAQAWLPQNLPLVFPGLRLLSEHLRTQGFDLALGEDGQGPVILLSTSNPGFSLEDLGQIAQESLYLQDLSTLELTLDDLGESFEIRSEIVADLDVTQSDNQLAATAKGPDGQVFRLNQANNALIISNRPPVIGLEEAQAPDECQNNPTGFVRPHALTQGSTFLGVSNLQTGWPSFLSKVQTISWKKTWLKVCW